MGFIAEYKELIVAGAVILAAVLVQLQRMGFISFQRPNKEPEAPRVQAPLPMPADVCPDPGCKATLTVGIAGLKEDIGCMRENIEAVFSKVNQTAKEVSELNGYIRGLHNGDRKNSREYNT